MEARKARITRTIHYTRPYDGLTVIIPKDTVLELVDTDLILTNQGDFITLHDNEYVIHCNIDGSGCIKEIPDHN